MHRTTLSAVFFVTILAAALNAKCPAVEKPVPENVQKLIAQLNDPDDRKQIAAAKELGRIGDHRAADELVKVIHWESGSIEQAAIDALRLVEHNRMKRHEIAASEIGVETADASQLGCLIVDLSSEHSAMRAAAALKLGTMKEQAVEAIPFLTRALSDEEYDLGGSENKDDLGTRVGERAKDALAKIGPAAVKPVVKMLDHERTAVRKRAAWVLGQTNDDHAVDPLLRMIEKKSFRDEDWQMQTTVVQSLGYLKDPRTIAPMLKLVDDKPDSRVAYEVCKSLRTVGPAGFDPLLKLLSHPNVDVREVAAAHFAKIRDPRTVDPLLKILNDKDEAPYVQLYAADRIDWIKEQRGTEPLLKLVKSESTFHEAKVSILRELQGHPKEVELLAASAPASHWSRELQSYALNRLKDIPAKQSLASVVKFLEESESIHSRAEAAEILGNLKGERKVLQAAVEPLIRAMDGEDSWVRGNAMYSLGRIGDERAVPHILKAIERLESLVSDSTIRLEYETAARSLSLFEDADSLTALLSLTKSKDWEIREVGCEALGNRKESEVAFALIKMLSNDAEKVRIAAVASLGKTGKLAETEAVSSLIVALNDTEEAVRSAAAGSLGTIANERAIDPLIRQLDDAKETVRRSAMRALSKFDDPRVTESMIRQLNDERSDARWLACYYLGQRPQSPAVIAALQKTLLNDSSDLTRARAAESLGQEGEHAVIEILKEALHDPSKRVRSKAAEAIKLIEKRLR